MTACEVNFGTEHRTVQTADELDRYLDDCDQRSRADDYPMLVDIYHSLDLLLTVGVGADLVPVSNSDETVVPPYVTSVGVDPGRRDVVQFGYGNTENDVLGATLIPYQQARQAAREFFTERHRPTVIEFRDDDDWIRLHHQLAQEQAD